MAGCRCDLKLESLEEWPPLEASGVTESNESINKIAGVCEPMWYGRSTYVVHQTKRENWDL